MKKTCSIILAALFLIISTSIASAAFSLSIDQVDPNTITSKELEVIVTLSLTDLPAGDSYFRAGWESGSSYTGYIKNNNGDWVELGSLTSDKDNQGCLNYFKINTATTSASLSLKIGTDNELTNGEVNIKAHRFTSTCGSNTGSNLFTTTINLPTPTPTPTSAPTSTPTATPTPTPIPVKTATPTPTPTKTPIPKASKTPSPTSEEVETENPIQTATSTPGATVLGKSTEKRGSLLPYLLIAGGVICLGFAGYFLYNRRSEEN